MATKEFIVAIELGSSKVTGIAGQKNLDGSINVLAVVKEEPSSFIRKGVVYTTDKTAVDGIAALMTFDASSVQTQVADVNTQISALIAPMACGVVKYEDGIDEALSMLEKAGINDIVAEFQAQFDASK